MKLKQTLSKTVLRIEALSLQTKIIIGSTVVILAGYGLFFGFPRPVDFAYTGQDCTRQLTIAPSLMKYTTDAGFEVAFDDVWAIQGVPIMAFKTCFSATEPPRPGTAEVRVSPWGGFFAAKVYEVDVAAPPMANVADFIDKTIPTTRPLAVGLTGVDEVFSYSFTVDKKSARCDHDAAVLQCDIESLGLSQGKVYQAALERSFNGASVETLGQGDIETLNPLELVSGSVSDGQTVYDKPTRYTFEYDKPLVGASAELKTESGDAVSVTTTIEGKQVIVTPANELPRNTSFVLTIIQAEADDGSALPAPYVVKFTLSGGPKVVSINTGATGIATSGVIVLTFDQDIANLEAAGKLVVVQGASAHISGSGKQVFIQYAAALCADVSVVVKKGFESEAGVVQDQDWGYGGRTQCYSVRTIGYSAQGRAINAFIFGSGSKTILYTGSIHGNEHSARYLMNLWVDELDANVRSIPAGTRIVVIPSVNPDGTAVNSRYNANGVDLNRNYNTSDWRQDVETVNGDPLPGGGGSAPGSEPETRALMAYTSELRPRLTMSYHSSAAYAIGNQCGDSAALAAQYAASTGYSNMTGVSGAFSYQITGTYDDWMCERLGLTSVLIELATSYSAEFNRNKAALWATARS